jgi:hypothetical protein
MKKSKMIVMGILVVLLVFGLANCGGGGGGTPTDIAKRFFAALEKGDTKILLGLLPMELGKELVPYAEEAKEQFLEVGGMKGIAKWEEEIYSDGEIVRPVFKDEDSDLGIAISFKKIDGKWQITGLE